MTLIWFTSHCNLVYVFCFNVTYGNVTTYFTFVPLNEYFTYTVTLGYMARNRCMYIMYY